MAQIYDQYVYKPIDNFDLSLNITEDNLNTHHHHHHHHHHNTSYMSVDQTFHTPSFGDEEFDIPPLHLPPTGNEAPSGAPEIYRNQQAVANQPSQQMTMVTTTNSTSRMIDPRYNSAAAQEMYMSQMNQNNIHMSGQQYNLQQQQQYIHPNNPGLEQHEMQCLPPPHTQSLVSVGGCQPMLTTISQSQLSSQLGLHIGISAGKPQNSGSAGCGSPPGSTHTSPGLETSEDSDDSTPLSQLVGSIKRPSPEPVDQVMIVKSATPKKPKPQKKKKKRDPNEPQKPVSAYALFFRDRQAAIKGQNPSATFGEVSKIVASLWDSLDADHKNVYKKKTEAAKKEYLKALAAYRASLVSKQAAADQSDSLYGSITSPNSTVSSGASSSPDRGPNLSPIQKKSPLLSSLMENVPSPIMTSMNAVSPPHSSVVTSQVWTMPISAATVHQSQPVVSTTMMDVSVPNMTQQVSSPPLMQSSQLVQQVQHNNNNLNQSVTNASFTQNMVNSPSPPHIPQGTNMSQLPISHSPLQTCLRHGCNNPPIDSPDWDREYCSNECVVSHCRDVFTAWVASRQAANSYASVK